MPGRREEKRQQTFSKVIEAARRRFGKAGYEHTTIEEIAEDAGVSPGTVYNYFGTKAAILLAVALHDSDHLSEAEADVADISRTDPVDALMPVVMAYISPLTKLPKDLVAEVLRASFSPSHPPLVADLAAMDERALARLARIIERMSGEGLAAPDVAPFEAAMLVFSVVVVAVLLYVAAHEMTSDSLDGFIRTHVALAYRGFAP